MRAAAASVLRLAAKQQKRVTVAATSHLTPSLLATSTLNNLSSRSVWSTGQTPPSPRDMPFLSSLTPSEITSAADLIKTNYTDVRFVAISLAEPPKGTPPSTTRQAEVLFLNTATGIASHVLVELDASSPKILQVEELPKGVQPLLTPDDCTLAEEISKNSPIVQEALKERYGITDMSRVAADPWSIHLADEQDIAMTKNEPDNGIPRRLVQTFLYYRKDGPNIEDNHYAHPIDILPVVDLNSHTCVHIDGIDKPPAEIPPESVNYHRDLLGTNSYLQTTWRANALKALDITQPHGPSFKVDGNIVKWQNWEFVVGFNYREGLTLHQVKWDGRSVLNKLSLVEMAVPYADPNPPFSRKCAFDVGDYGLGFCANSLELGCDCLGHIHYFDAALNDSKGDPYVVNKAICMHEEDDGTLDYLYALQY